MRDEEIPGYIVEIPSGVWQRVTTLGAPRLWLAGLTVVCALAFLSLLFRGYGLLALLPVLLWPVGYGGLVLLTLWDEQFDEVLLVTSRYKSRYKAG